MVNDEIFEFRDYHYDGDLDAYAAWWAEALPILRPRCDVRGVWIDSGVAPRIAGSAPMDLPHGSANVTWVIRWDGMEQREESWAALWEDREWQDCWSRHPGTDNYLHMSVRFLRSL